MAANPKSIKIPTSMQQEFIEKKIDSAHLGIHAFKSLNRQLLEHYYSIIDKLSRGRGFGQSESAMLGEGEQEKFKIISKLKDKYCGEGKSWQECHAQTEEWIKDLQTYLLGELVRLGNAVKDEDEKEIKEKREKDKKSKTEKKEKVEKIDYSDALTNLEKLQYKESEANSEIETIKTALRLLLSSKTSYWESLFHPGSAKDYKDIPFRDLLGLYWRAASDAKMEMDLPDPPKNASPEVLEAYEVNKEIERNNNLEYAKKNFAIVLSEIRRAHNERAADGSIGNLHDPVDNPSCAPGTFGRITCSSVMFNKAAMLSANPFNSTQLKLKIIDFIMEKMRNMVKENELTATDVTRIGKYLSEEGMFLAGEEEDKNFIFDKFISKFFSGRPEDGKINDKIQHEIIEFLKQNVPDLKFIFEQMTGSDSQRYNELKPFIMDALKIHLQSLIEPQNEIAPDEKLMSAVIIESVNAKLQKALEEREKKTLEKGLEEFRTETYSITLEMLSINQEIMHEYAKMMLSPSYIMAGYKRIEQLVQQADDLERDYKEFYDETIANFEDLANEVMVNMMQQGELPPISPEYEDKIRKDINQAVEKAVSGVLTKTTMERKKFIDEKMPALKEIRQQKVLQIADQLPKMPGISMALMTSKTSMTSRASISTTVQLPYTQKAEDWAKYIIALAARANKTMEGEIKKVEELEEKIKKEQERLANYGVLESGNVNDPRILALNKERLELKKRREDLLTDYIPHKEGDQKLINDLLILAKDLDPDQKQIIAKSLNIALARPEIQSEINKVDPNNVASLEKLLNNNGFGSELAAKAGNILDVDIVGKAMQENKQERKNERERSMLGDFDAELAPKTEQPQGRRSRYVNVQRLMEMQQPEEPQEEGDPRYRRRNPYMRRTPQAEEGQEEVSRESFQYMQRPTIPGLENSDSSDDSSTAKKPVTFEKPNLGQQERARYLRLPFRKVTTSMPETKTSEDQPDAALPTGNVPVGKNIPKDKIAVQKAPEKTENKEATDNIEKPEKKTQTELEKRIKGMMGRAEKRNQARLKRRMEMIAAGKDTEKDDIKSGVEYLSEKSADTGMVEWFDQLQKSMAAKAREQRNASDQPDTAPVEGIAGNVGRYFRRDRGPRYIYRGERQRYMRRFALQPQDIVSFQNRGIARKLEQERQRKEDKENARYLSAVKDQLSPFGYQEMIISETKSDVDSWKARQEAAKAAREAAINEAQGGSVGAFRITPGERLNQFWIFGKALNGSITKISVLVNSQGFLVEGTEGKPSYTVPTIDILKRQIVITLNSVPLGEMLVGAQTEQREVKQTSELTTPTVSTKKLFVFDFDETLVLEHWHNTLTRLKIPQGYPSEDVFNYLMGNPSSLENIHGPMHNPGLRDEAMMKKTLRAMLDKGHHIAIATFSKYPGIVKMALKRLGLTQQEINQKIFYPETDLSVDVVEGPTRKNPIILAAMKHFGVKEFGQVTLIDDDNNNRDIAGRLRPAGSLKLTSSGFDISNVVSTLDPKVERTHQVGQVQVPEYQYILNNEINAADFVPKIKAETQQAASREPIVQSKTVEPKTVIFSIKVPGSQPTPSGVEKPGIDKTKDNRTTPEAGEKKPSEDGPAKK